MIETDKAQYEAFEGMDAQTSPTNLAAGVYSEIRGWAPIHKSLQRIYGKTLHSTYTGAIISMTVLADTKLIIQRASEMHIVDL